MVPYTMLESWAFRDLERSLAWSEGHPLHQQAGQDPGVLEETPHVKDRSPLGNRRNLELFNRRWPAADAYADGRSFKAFVDALERAVVSAS
ncbi:MAG: hypothetical protein KC656_15845 [Myxococcales bacterium]|nr:hypothetical protein [Myxococcales bacterium]